MKINRRQKTRLDKIETSLYEHGFLTVSQLSDLCQVSLATTRRDLQILVDEDRVERFHGGAKLKSQKLPIPGISKEQEAGENAVLLEQIDALIVTAIDTEPDAALLQYFFRGGKPIIAESVAAKHVTTLVAVNNYLAGVELGNWAGEYAKMNWDGEANYLDLSYHLPNTQERSHGFIDGLRQVLPNSREVLSINAQSNYRLAYQLTTDALTVHKDINVIFAINDTCAYGAINACQDLSIDPESVIVISFGLEGATMLSLLAEGIYCRAALAMFPDIVGRVCVQAAFEAQQGTELPEHLITPHRILTTQSMHEFYEKADEGWQLKWDAVNKYLDIPLEIAGEYEVEDTNVIVGFTIRYRAHEWYQSLTTVMQNHANRLNIDFRLIDIDQTLKDELNVRRCEIAQKAAAEIQTGDIIIIDSGPISIHLAQAIQDIDYITVITNNQAVLEILKGNPNMTLMSTGGVVQENGYTMAGPIAEAALRNLHADKLFLMVSGITSGFVLSHDNVSEITIKQEMIKSAREIILLADNMCFRSESVIRFSPLKAITKLIADEALPASSRLEITKLGIQVVF